MDSDGKTEIVYGTYVGQVGCLDPADRRVDVQVQMRGQLKARDLLASEGLPIKDGSFPAMAHPGGLRTIEITAEAE